MIANTFFACSKCGKQEDIKKNISLENGNIYLEETY